MSCHGYILWSTACSALAVQGVVTDMLQENVVQPLLVSVSAIRLASECVRSILKIDDVVIGIGMGCQWCWLHLILLSPSLVQVNAR